MPMLTLSDGMQTQVDQCDYDDLAQFEWSDHWNGQDFYAVRWIGDRRSRQAEYMHRRIMGLEYGDKRQVDHKNHDTLDNRNQNLQVVTCRKNNENRRNQSKWGPGVWKSAGGFRAHVYDGRRHLFGPFDTPEEAQRARAEFLKDKE